MGYDTKLIFVKNHYTTFRGYCNVVATLEICKIGYEGAVADLMNEIKNRINIKKQNEYKKKIKQMNNNYRKVFNGYGDYWGHIGMLPESERDKLYDKYSDIHGELEKDLPYIYTMYGDMKSFDDCYGDILMVATLDELREAIVKDNKDDPHYRYEMAISLIDSFKNEYWEGKVKVILYGHQNFKS